MRTKVCGGKIMNRYLCNNTERYEIPEWARAENMEACYSQAELWKMSEQVVKEKQSGNKFRRYVAMRLYKLADKISDASEYPESRGYAEA